MPQMAPMSWMLMFIFFIFIFILFNINNFYFIMHNPKKMIMKKTLLTKNWKW